MRVLNVKTVYRDENYKVLKTNLSSKPKRACARAYEYMLDNAYGAVRAEVYDPYEGKLYATLFRSVTGEIRTDPDHDTAKDEPITQRGMKRREQESRKTVP